jgi:hypothetical protein
MNSPILPARGPRWPATPMNTAKPVGGAIPAALADLPAGAGTFAIEAARGAPPAELLELLAAASRVCEGLRARGRALRFAGGDGARPAIALCDLDGDALRTLSISEAIEIAAGSPAE